jgi:LysM repeat protein
LITAASDTHSKQIAQSRKEPVIVPEGSQGSPISRYAINADSLPPAVTQPAPRSSNTPAISPGRNVPAPARNVAQTKPTTTGVPLKASAVSKAKPSAGGSHVVGKGDTIFSIAKRNGVSEKAIMKLNGISDASKLRPGQKLKMPAGN